MNSFLWNAFRLDGSFNSGGGMMVWTLLIAGGVALVVALVTVLLACFEEVTLFSERWCGRHHPFADAGQTNAVHTITARLGSARRRVRLEAVSILRQLGDTTAVPALRKALVRYDKDVPFALAVVETMTALRDPRALPALRPLTAGRHYRLMQAARQAIDALEAKSTLLRITSMPAETGLLLRAVHGSRQPAEERQLLRAQTLQAGTATGDGA